MVLVLLRIPGTKVNIEREPNSISRADINIIATKMQQLCNL